MKIRRIPALVSVRKKRAAAYCRVSTDKAGQEESLETQASALSRVILANPAWEFAGVYADEGKSGVTANRPRFREMISRALAGRIDLILVKSVSRFSRSAVDCLTYVELLRAADVAVRFERERLDSSNPACAAALSLLAAIAQDESRSISENVRWAAARRRARGEYKIGNNQVLGCDADGAGRPVPNKSAWMVRMMFDLFIAGKGCGEIARLVTAAGGRGLRGGPVSHQAVRAVLRNEIYAGDRALQKCPPRPFPAGASAPAAPPASLCLRDAHPPLVSRDVWEAAQRRLSLCREQARAGIFCRAGVHFLYGKVFCASCGAPYTRRTVTDFRKGKKTFHKAWNCRGRQHGSGCKNPSLREDALLRAVAAQTGVRNVSSSGAAFPGGLLPDASFPDDSFPEDPLPEGVPDADRFLSSVDRVLIRPDGSVSVLFLSPD